MGNQNATGMHEEDKAANQCALKETKDDQLILPKAETEELLSAPSALSDHDSPGDHHFDDQKLDIKDDPKDATLSSTGAILLEPDSMVHSDAQVDDHAVEKINQDPYFHVSRESKVTSCSIDEISIRVAEEEIGLTAEKMLEAEDLIQGLIVAEEECEANSQNHHPEMSSTEEVNAENSSSNASMEHINTKDETLSNSEETDATKGINCNDENSGGSDQNQVVEASEYYDQTEDMCNVNGDSEAEKEPEMADVKGQETVDGKADDISNLTHGKNDQFHPQEAVPEAETRVNMSEEQVRISSEKQHHNTQSEMEKSPSFNFDLIKWDHKTEELDQTPLLYHKKLAPMRRSLSTPGNTRFLIPLTKSDEERTIKIVQETRRESDDKPIIPLQENHEKAEDYQNLKESHKGNGMEIVASIKEKPNKSRNSGSYLFSICICCTGVAQLNGADP